MRANGVKFVDSEFWKTSHDVGERVESKRYDTGIWVRILGQTNMSLLKFFLACQHCEQKSQGLNPQKTVPDASLCWPVLSSHTLQSLSRVCTQQAQRTLGVPYVLLILKEAERWTAEGPSLLPWICLHKAWKLAKWPWENGGRQWERVKTITFLFVE